MSETIPHLLGVLLATGAAGFFAVQYLCVRLGTIRGAVSDVVFVTLLTNVIIVVPLTVVVHGIPELDQLAVVWFILAGITGSLLARMTMFKSIEAIGASRTAPIISANVFFATVLAVILFGETLTIPHGIGIVLIVGGVSVISWETAQDADPDQSIRELGVTLFLPLIAALFLGIEPLFVSLGLDAGAAVLPGVAISTTAAAVGFFAYLLLSGTVFDGIVTWSPEMGWFLIAGASSTFGIIGVFAALAVAPVVTVIPLLQTAPLMVLCLSALFLPASIERVTWPLVSAALVVVAGAVLVSVQ